MEPMFNPWEYYELRAAIALQQFQAWLTGPPPQPAFAWLRDGTRIPFFATKPATGYPRPWVPAE